MLNVMRPLLRHLKVIQYDGECMSKIKIENGNYALKELLITQRPVSLGMNRKQKHQGGYLTKLQGAV